MVFRPANGTSFINSFIRYKKFSHLIPIGYFNGSRERFGYVNIKTNPGKLGFGIIVRGIVVEFNKLSNVCTNIGEEAKGPIFIGQK